MCGFCQLYRYGKPDAKTKAVDGTFAPKDAHSHNFTREKACALTALVASHVLASW